MYKLNTLFFMIQRGMSDDLFIKYFDENYDTILNSKSNIGGTWLFITKEHSDFLKFISIEVK